MRTKEHLKYLEQKYGIEIKRIKACKSYEYTAKYRAFVKEMKSREKAEKSIKNQLQ